MCLLNFYFLSSLWTGVLHEVWQFYRGSASRNWRVKVSGEGGSAKILLCSLPPSSTVFHCDLCNFPCSFLSQPLPGNFPCGQSAPSNATMGLGVAARARGRLQCVLCTHSNSSSPGQDSSGVWPTDVSLRLFLERMAKRSPFCLQVKTEICVLLLRADVRTPIICRSLGCSPGSDYHSFLSSVFLCG